MQELDDIALLQEYVEHGSEEAFVALVGRHVNKVYSVALRHTGNPHSAEEIAHAVFVILAAKAGRLGRRVILSGWLYQTARLTAVTFVRGEIRRARREEEAHMQSIVNEKEPEVWTQIAPLLDAAMAGLNETDRHAVVLRFFDGRSMREVGAALGANEDAAKKRVNRALEKLRHFFTKHGVSSTATAIAAAITAHSVEAAPVMLAKSITTVALTKGTAAGTSTLTLAKGALKIMALMKAKTGIVAAVAAASFILPLVVQHQAQARLREADESLRAQTAQLAELRAKNDRLSKQAGSVSLTKHQSDDLQRLRAEVGTLGQQAKAVEQLREDNRRLKAAIGQDKPKTPVQLKEEAIAKLGYGKNLLVSFYQYAQEHQGQFPKNYADAASYLSDEAKNQSDVTTDQFDIVFQGFPSDLEKPQDTIVLKEKEAANVGDSSHPAGKWAKVYVFADGHSELHMEPENNFDAYEQKHTVTPPSVP